MRLLSSPKLTSNCQCRLFSISQWPRSACAHRRAVMRRLPMKYFTSVVVFPPTVRSRQRMPTTVILAQDIRSRRPSTFSTTTDKVWGENVAYRFELYKKDPGEHWVAADLQIRNDKHLRLGKPVPEAVLDIVMPQFRGGL